MISSNSAKFSADFCRMPEIRSETLLQRAFRTPPISFFSRDFSVLSGQGAASGSSGKPIDGTGIGVAVIDTGCRSDHTWMTGRVKKGLNVINGGSDAEDSDGHGTAVCGAIASDYSRFPGSATGCSIVPVKITESASTPTWSNIKKALEALLETLSESSSSLEFSAVVLPYSDDRKYTDAEQVYEFENEAIKRDIAGLIAELRKNNVPTLTAAGNNYRCDPSGEIGMGFPAILPEALSVGASYSGAGYIPGEDEGVYCDAFPDNISRGTITAFSNRMPKGDHGNHYTRLFAPGAPIKSAGISSASAATDSIFGTSIAVSNVAGVVARLQQAYRQEKGETALPDCDDLERWLRDSGEPVFGPDGEPTDTFSSFKRVNAQRAIDMMMREISPSG